MYILFRDTDKDKTHKQKIKIWNKIMENTIIYWNSNTNFFFVHRMNIRQWNSPELHVITQTICAGQEQLFLLAMELHKLMFSHNNNVFWGIFDVNVIHFMLLNVKRYWSYGMLASSVRFIFLLKNKLNNKLVFFFWKSKTN